MKNLLFVCLMGKNRSRTAAELCATWEGYEAQYAGTDKYTEFPLTSENLSWATLVFTMERDQAKKIRKRFPTETAGKSIACLGIPDDYDYGDPILAERLERIIKHYLNS